MKMKTLAVEYKVKSNLDIGGGKYFSDLSKAYEYISIVIREQTDPEAFECDDFEKINYIQLVMYFKNIDKKPIKMSEYSRKSDTEFIERINTATN